MRKRPALYLDWCRTKGHPFSCNCEYRNTDPRGAAGSDAARKARKGGE